MRRIGRFDKAQAAAEEIAGFENRLVRFEVMAVLVLASVLYICIMLGMRYISRTKTVLLAKPLLCT